MKCPGCADRMLDTAVLCPDCVAALPDRLRRWLDAGQSLTDAAGRAAVLAVVVDWLTEYHGPAVDEPDPDRARDHRIDDELGVL